MFRNLISNCSALKNPVAKFDRAYEGQPTGEMDEVSAVQSPEWRKLADFFQKLSPNADA